VTGSGRAASQCICNLDTPTSGDNVADIPDAGNHVQWCHWEETRVAMSLSSRARRPGRAPRPAHHMSRRATGGLLQDGAAGFGRAVWHAQAVL